MVKTIIGFNQYDLTEVTYISSATKSEILFSLGDSGYFGFLFDKDERSSGSVKILVEDFLDSVSREVISFNFVYLERKVTNLKDSLQTLGVTSIESFEKISEVPPSTFSDRLVLDYNSTDISMDRSNPKGLYLLGNQAISGIVTKNISLHKNDYNNTLSIYVNKKPHITFKLGDRTVTLSEAFTRLKQYFATYSLESTTLDEDSNILYQFSDLNIIRNCINILTEDGYNLRFEFCPEFYEKLNAWIQK